MKSKSGFFVVGLLWWGLLALAAVANGFIRGTTYAQGMSDVAARALSSFLLIVVIWAGAYVYCRLSRYPYGIGDLWVVGAAWLILTVGFEIAFGRWAEHRTWAALAGDYNLAAGRTWPLVLLATVVGPPMMGRLAARRKKEDKR